MTAALIKPQRTGIVHHVILYEAAGAQAIAARQLNAHNGGQGWSCFGGPEPAARRQRARRGRPARPAAVDRGLGAGPHDERVADAAPACCCTRARLVVMQVHYNLIEASGPDRSSAQLRLRPASTHLIPLETHLIAAPVELPCPDGVTGPQCSRQQAVQDEVDKYGAEAAFVPAALLQICDKTLADYPMEVGNGTSITTSCDRPITSDADDLRRRRPHASPRARHLDRARPGDGEGSRRCCTSRRGSSTGRTSTTSCIPSRSGPATRSASRAVRQLEGRPAGDRLQAAHPALRALGRGHDRRDVPRDALRRRCLTPSLSHRSRRAPEGV